MTAATLRLLAQLVAAFAAVLLALPGAAAAAPRHSPRALIPGCQKHHRAKHARCAGVSGRCARKRTHEGCRVSMQGLAPTRMTAATGAVASPPLEPNPQQSASPATQLPPPVSDTPAVDAPVASSRPLFGFNDQSIGYSLATPAQDAELSRRGGATVARVTFDWRWAEPNQGQWDLARYDALYRELTARGIRPVWVLLFAPHWAWDASIRCDQWHSDCTFPPAPEHDGDWQAMARMVAQRYPQSAAIEVWNEPNLYAFWRPAPDPARYTQLLAEAYGAVKSADPAMPVLGGAVTNSPIDGSWGLSESHFLGSIFDAGAGRSMDALSVHLYKQGMPGDDSIGIGLRDARIARSRAGLVDMPIWITETGVSTTDTNPGYRVTDEQQATTIVGYYQRLAAMPDIAAVIVHTLVERPVETGTTEVGFGLVRRDLTPKPAYCALAAAVGTPGACD